MDNYLTRLAGNCAKTQRASNIARSQILQAVKFASKTSVTRGIKFRLIVRVRQPGLLRMIGK